MLQDGGSPYMWHRWQTRYKSGRLRAATNIPQQAIAVLMDLEKPTAPPAATATSQDDERRIETNINVELGQKPLPSGRTPEPTDNLDLLHS